MSRPVDRADFDVGLPIEVDVAVRTGQAPEDQGKETAVPVLLRFAGDVTPDRAEAVLGRLQPPDEGIVLASNGAVIVRARQPFVDYAESRDCITLVNPVSMQGWEPRRHRIREG